MPIIIFLHMTEIILKLNWSYIFFRFFPKKLFPLEKLFDLLLKNTLQIIFFFWSKYYSLIFTFKTIQRSGDILYLNRISTLTNFREKIKRLN